MLWKINGVWLEEKRGNNKLKLRCGIFIKGLVVLDLKKSEMREEESGKERERERERERDKRRVHLF